MNRILPVLMLSSVLCATALAQTGEGIETPASAPVVFVQAPADKADYTSPWATLIPIIVAGLVTVIGAIGVAGERIRRAGERTVAIVRQHTEAVEQQTSVLRETASLARVATGMLRAQQPPREDDS